MIVKDIKISELTLSLINQLSADDLFFYSSIRYDDVAEEEINYDFPYTSYALPLSSMVGSIVHRPRTVSSQWTFDSKEHPPLQTTRFDPTNFFNNYILNENNRKDIIGLNGNGAYSQNRTFFPQNQSSTMLDTKNISQYSIANIDYVDRMAALLFQTWIEQLTGFVDAINRDAIIPSKIGDIVYSSTLNTKDKVRKFYGNGRLLFKIGDYESYAPNTNWLQHKGTTTADDYYLIASSSGVVANSAQKTDGSNSDRTITESMMKKHRHKVDLHGHSVSISSSSNEMYIQNATAGQNGRIKTGDGTLVDEKGSSIGAYKPTYGTSITVSSRVSVGGCGDKNTNDTGVEDPKINIEQAYKNVYVWERIPL